MSKFFINRPIVAMVISIMMVIIGAVTIVSLPVALFPQIAPPEVQVSAIYTGADAQTIEQSVATPIEQQMSGVDNMNYMYSLNATANGQMRLIVNFDVKTDPNTDLILADLRENLAQSQLPAEVNAYGITVTKTLTAPLMLVSLNSPHSTYDAQFLANYAYINLNDQLTRVPGIGSVQVFGAGQYAMRLMGETRSTGQARHHRAGDCQCAADAKHRESGRTGGQRADSQGAGIHLLGAGPRAAHVARRVRADCGAGNAGWRDCARQGCGAGRTRLAGLLHRGRLNGKPSAIIAIYQLPGSNAVQAAEGVNKLMAEAKKRFPADVDYVIPLDTTRAVTEGMREIVETLVIAILLVIVVVYIFLQGWRATLDSAAGGARSRSSARSFSSRCLDFPSTRYRYSGWCWRSAWWWTTPLWWWKRWNAISRTEWRPKKRH